MKAEHIKNLLNEKYSDSDKCLIAFEVNEGTGTASGRKADAVAMYLWPSLDYKVIGFEIKVSRSDWLNEMKQPDKSLAISQFCDEWYLVAPAGVLGIDELPKTWGYMQASEKALTTKIRAPKRDSAPMSSPFVASLMRSAVGKYQDTSFMNSWYDREREKIRKEVESRNEREIKNLSDKIAELKLLIHDFNEKTGTDLSKYNMGRIVDVVNMLRDKDRREELIDRTRRDLTSFRQAASFQEKLLEDLQKINTEGQAKA